MALTQPLVSLGLLIVLTLGAGYGGYKLLSLVVPSERTPVKMSRFEAGNIPTGLGRIWFPLQYYGYLLIYTTIEPIIVLLFLIAYAPFYNNFIEFRNLFVVVGSFIVLVYPVLYYSIKQINVVLNWVLNR
ncbi:MULTISPECIES: NADH-quinone oxidoreductase subunit A [Acidianus]|uniref:NADH dehydrogenase n=1 Tax=Candidatus Acidianus copahuensis TaxID=1160895 RepID=A0A031LPH0_9CREN|nr:MULTISPECIES: NADH-quinone oxidoreductase subunit A [Acidianus]EZQ06977.1 NADH dehydrogenase [Candidatus Acidianus copahuensis]NON61994.1 NAD(P)H-quinone oxidoreductase subunit 3 [Acidianus sp. RZ1]